MDDNWIWSLDQPEPSGWCWIVYWTTDPIPLPGVMRFVVGDKLPENVACWQYLNLP
jgi:hypothetical protein